MSSGTILKVENLVRHFGKVKAVDGISFELKAGQSVGLIGANGASCKIKCDTESPSPKVSIGAQTALAGWGDRGKDDNESFPLVEAMK